MQTFGAFLVSLLCTGAIAAAVPAHVGIPARGGNYSVPSVHNAAFVRHGPQAYAKAYRKFGKPLPANLAKAIGASSSSKRDGGSATNTPTQYDSEYLTPVQIGTPAQTLQLDFDTGSSDLWVFSTETPAGEVDGQTVYSPSKSSTSKALRGESWSISYGDGSSSSGDVYADTVAVGGLTVQGQAVEAAKKVSSEFTSDASDGLLGLAFSSINTVTPRAQKTFFDNAQASLDAPLFTADLKHNADGTYNFGFIDSSAYTGSVTYTDVDNSQGFWSWTSTGYAVGNGSLKSTSIAGIADTGTTLLLLPNSIVKAYYKQVKGAKLDNSQGGYTFSCSAKLPDFKFGVEGSTITIPGDYINFAPLEEGSSTCFGGIQSDDGIGFAIFGDVALKAAFVVFNGDGPQLGWASKNL
ncbi:secreted aspartic proteinase precursor [Niveomyces insectorum RCEF 264]|uniref:Secreted aspartic proteinase n=1 Tax=Niveomyces insectorum RCEF 264 TaxID=1081102 RepID=A0A162MU21_9HYPO|nr:secreted aspartic proteinase precursor [Niveomyces insectorum RCEF 264]